MALTQVSTNGIKDATIATADIADDAVTLAKMAGGTDGQIITYDASGNPVAVGPGTDGQVLTSTGAGSPPAFETPAAGVGGATGVDFNDDVKIRLGTGNDLEIYHTGSHGYITEGTGNLKISAASGPVQILKGSSENIAAFTPDNSCDLYYDNSLKLTTQSWGVDITGTLRADDITLQDSHILKIGSDNDLQLTHSGADSTISKTTAGNLLIYVEEDFYLKHGTEKMIAAKDDSKIELYYDGSLRFSTETDGVRIWPAGGSGTINLNTSVNGDVFNLSANKDGTDTTGIAFKVQTTGGSSVERVRVTENGLTFNGDTANSNSLDDYEQGAFTPILRKSGDTTGQVSGTGAYTKIGNVVHAKICFANKACSNIPNGAVAEIVGLPFNAHHGTHSDEMAISGPMVEMGIAQRNGGIFRTTTATSYLRAYYMQNNSTWAVWYVDDFNNSGVYLIFGITYLTT